MKLASCLRQNQRLQRHRRARIEFLEPRHLLAADPISLADPALFGDSANGISARPSISDDGQRIVFESMASNLAINDANVVSDIYLNDFGLGAVSLVSVGLNGEAANNHSFNPRISGDGRFVVFESDATNLVAGDTNNRRDVFVRDLINQTTVRVSVSTAGTQGDLNSRNAVITPDGRYVAFESEAANLAGTNANGDALDIFVRDLVNNTTTLVSVQAGTTTSGNAGSTTPVITPDGRHVAFVSSATNLTTDGDTNSSFDVFVRDIVTGTTRLVSITTTGVAGGGNNPSISASGQFISFESRSGLLTAGDTDGGSDIFVRDIVNDTTSIVSISDDELQVTGEAINAVMSSDGNVIAFVSNSTVQNYVPGTPISINTYNIFVRNRSEGTTRLASISTSGGGGNGLSAHDGNGNFPNVPLAISSSGRYVGFVSMASNLVSGDANSVADVFVRDLQTNTTHLASTTGSASGNAASGFVNNTSPPFTLAAGGGFVAFQSLASDLVAGDNNKAQDIFRRDLAGGSTQFASLRGASFPLEFMANHQSTYRSSTPDGRFVLFTTQATNISSTLTINSGIHLYRYDRQTDTATPIDINPAGTALVAIGNSTGHISDDGRYVAFQSDAGANQLVSGLVDNNGFSGDVYWRDLQTGTTRIVSAGTVANQTGNAGSTLHGMSADGQMVLFESRATNLVSGFVDGNGATAGDVFVRRMTPGSEQTFLVSSAAGSTTTGGNSESNGLSVGGSAISPDGTKVAFTSRATNLVAGFTDGNTAGQNDVFLRDLTTGVTTLVSQSAASSTTSSNHDSQMPVFSADGMHVGFSSSATNLVAGATDTNNSPDLFLRDLAGGTTMLISARNGSSTATGNATASSFSLRLSADGRYAAFTSFASNLTADSDANNTTDVFWRDMQTSTTQLVSIAAAGGSGASSSSISELSDNGRLVAFSSFSTNLVTGIPFPNAGQFYVRDMVTATTSLISYNAQVTAASNNSSNAGGLSRDGSTVFLQTIATDIFLGDRNDRQNFPISDVYAYQLNALSAIRGRVFRDTNGNGIQDGGETGLENWIVFLDDGDGVRQVGERFAVSDANGDFVFSNLTPGSYIVDVTIQPGFEQTGPTPAPPGAFTLTLANNGDTSTGNHFALRPLAADLAATLPSPPAAALVGETIHLEWRIENIGGSDASGTWQDAVFLSPTPILTHDSILLKTVTRTGRLASGDDYLASAEITIPSVQPGSYYLIVQSDRRVELPGDAQRANNIATSPLALDVTTLSLDTPFGSSFTAPGQARHFKVVVPPGGTLQIDLESAAAEGSLSLFVRRGSLPTLWDHDFASDSFSPDQQLLVPNPPGGTYYILAHSNSGAAINAAFEITASIENDLVVNASSPATGGNGGRVTVEIRGANFTHDVSARLSLGVTTLDALAIDRVSSSVFYATFDLTGVAIGAYELAVHQGLQTEIVPQPFTVEEYVEPDPWNQPLRTRLLVPGNVRIARENFLVVEYENLGTVDIPAPLYALATQSGSLRLEDDASYLSDSVSFVGISPEGPAGILRPGQKGRTIVRFFGAASGEIPFQLNTLPRITETIDWEAQKADLRPSTVDPAAWDAIFAQFVDRVGTSTEGLALHLAAAASNLSQMGIRTGNVVRLLGFDFALASAGLIDGGIAGRIDAEFPTPGLSLHVTSQFAPGIAGHYRQGPLGRGWVHSWETELTVDANGHVLLQQGTGVRFFARKFDGKYQSQPGDIGVLTQVGAVFQLREADGTIRRFLANGQLDYVQDTHGNRITVSYDGDGQITALTHTSGAALTFSYDGDRLSQIVDPAGRTTSFVYDTANEHLISVTDERGTRSYAYVLGEGAAREHALQQATGFDGTSRFYSYDLLGRVIQVALDGGAEPLTISYDAFGGVTFTNAENASMQILYSDQGLPEQVVDPLGRTLEFDYDLAGNLLRQVAPSGLASFFQYDSRNNLIRSTNPAGDAVSFSYDTMFNQMTSMTDARHQTTSYSYNAQGDLRSITYANGASEEFDYDPLGNLSEILNRRGQALGYTRNSQGLVARKDFADGSFQTFEYDARGNMTLAQTRDGAAVLTQHFTFEYDDADRLTRLDNLLESRFLEFTYDSQGRRAKSEDQDGFTVHYSYDSLGRLSELTDGGNARIVLYSYDSLGRLSRKNLGNGTFTTYSYDAASQLLSLVNHRDAMTINSRFDYTYDGDGRRLTMTTLDGLTSYGYDVLGQLTSISLPGGRLITYEFDAAGNRVRVTDSGVPTDYTVNELNEYTQVGAATYTYDADGNLASVTDASGTTTYTWSQENQLLSITGPGGSFSYEYDSLGNRIAATEGATRTEFLIDPFGFGNIFGEYSGASTVNYAHGFDLAARFGGGESHFYDFDTLGNTTGLTEASGAYVNRYSYLPFGETTVLSQALSNPFQFVGAYGVTANASDLLHMRFRNYDSAVGQFTSPDPIGLNGGDVNLRRYVLNAPTVRVDPLGMAPLGQGGPYARYSNAELRDAADESLKEHSDALTEARNSERESSEQRFGGVYAMLSSPYGSIAHIMAEDKAQASEDLARYLWEHKLPGIETRLKELQKEAAARGISIGLEAWDPNDITGPAGFDTERFIQPTGSWPYTIRFENQPSATAPAQEVFITQQLDSDLDWSTFEFLAFGFGDRLIDVPAGLQAYATQVDYLNLDGSALRVDVSMVFNAETGQIDWTFLSTDPATGEYPPGVFDGFLPPEDGTGRGQGFVVYVASPRSHLATGTEVTAQASIIFDTNEPLVTNVHLNTIDRGAPNSAVVALPPLSDASFTVSWQGVDDAGGSGVATFDIFVSRNGAPLELWLDDTSDLSATYQGQPGQSYAFYSLATDQVGNSEVEPGSPATTQVVGFDFGDAPASYGTLLADDGARHRLGSGLRLGSAVDAEADGLSSQSALGDDQQGVDDEDGVQLPAVLVAGNIDVTGAGVVNQISITASAAAYLDAWIDFNRDGDFDANEQIAASFRLQAGLNTLVTSVPVNANPGLSYARFRISSAGGLQPIGSADDGEVEDYAVQIANPALGTATIIPDPTNAAARILYIKGTTKNDAIIVRPTPSGSVTVYILPVLTVATFALNSFDRIVIQGLEGNDSIAIEGTLAKPTVIYGDAGNDTISGGAGPDLIFGGPGNDSILGNGGDDVISSGPGNDTLAGGSGFNRLVEFGAGTITLTNTLFRSGNETNIISQFGSATITGGNAADTFTVTGWSGALTIDGGLGSNTVVDGGNANFRLTETSLIRTNAATRTVGLTNIHNARLTGGAGHNTFDLSAWPFPATLNGEQGTDSFIALGDTNFTLADTLLLRPGQGSIRLNSIEQATLHGGSSANLFNVTFWTKTATLNGHDGQDKVVASGNMNFTLTNLSLARSAAGAITLSSIEQAELTGGAGNNTLNAAAFSGQVKLDGGAGNDTLTSGAGLALLLGGAGNDRLTAGSGRSVQIGGNGLDRLTGGSNDDLLISGQTIHDSNAAALALILAEWSSAASYADRVAHLTGTPGGLNGSLRLDGPNVIHDSAVDILIGGLGADLFFAKRSSQSGSPQDSIADKAPNESVF